MMLRVAQSPAFTPAQYTIFGWEVSDIKTTITDLSAKGVDFLHLGFMPQDEQGYGRTRGCGHSLVQRPRRKYALRLPASGMSYSAFFFGGAPSITRLFSTLKTPPVPFAWIPAIAWSIEFSTAPYKETLPFFTTMLIAW